MSFLLTASTPKEMITADRPLVELILGKTAVVECTITVCNYRLSVKEAPEIDITDYGTKRSDKLRKLVVRQTCYRNCLL
jgi:hypothetical protein